MESVLTPLLHCREISPKKTGSVHQDIGLILFDCPGLINLDLPFSNLIIPDRLFDLGVELDVLVKIPFLHCALDVLVDFWTRSVKVRPVRIGLEEERIRI